MKKHLLIIISFLLLAAFSKSEANQAISLIDVPTADAIDSYGYDVSFRFYTNGGIIGRASFGVLQRVNIGFAWDFDKFIGSDSIDVQEPTLNVKLRIFDGQLFLPALALGYDGQGYAYSKVLDEYLHREKGVYIAASKEIFFPGLEYHLGGNVYDFKKDEVFGFAGLAFYLIETFAILAEYDNIRLREKNRFNAGIRLFLSPTISVDLAARDIAAPGRDEERIVRINYMGSF
ncbi:MAG: hypothetical protein ABII27_05735 [bacterium]